MSELFNVVGICLRQVRQSRLCVTRGGLGLGFSFISTRSQRMGTGLEFKILSSQITGSIKGNEHFPMEY